MHPSTFYLRHHCLKSVRIRNYSGPYFPAIGLNTEKYSECGKVGQIIRMWENKDQNNSEYGHSLRSAYWEDET